MTEQIDIFNTTNHQVGQCDKKEAHRKGLWHRTVCFLLVDSKKKTIYFQDRTAASEMKTDDFFVKLNGGHLKAGEKVEDGVRELEEELGLKIDKAQLIPVGINQIAVDFSADYKIREFMYFFIIDLNQIPTKVLFTDREVKALIEFSPDEAVDTLTGKNEKVNAQVFDGKTSKGLFLRASAFKNFTDDNLYLRILTTVSRYFSGEDTARLVI